MTRGVGHHPGPPSGGAEPFIGLECTPIPDIVAMRSCLTELERDLDRCVRGLVRTEELHQILSDYDRRIEALFGRTSDSFRLWDRRSRERTDWTEDTISGFATGRDADNLAYRISTVRQVLDMLSPEFLRDIATDQSQYFFDAGDVFRARQRFFGVLQRAKARLDICDQYLDTSALDFIEALDSALTVRLLVGKPTQFLVQQIQTLQVTRPALSARANTLSHDRWVILDSSEVWHLGASVGFPSQATS
jgi:hypothetical protein